MMIWMMQTETGFKKDKTFVLPEVDDKPRKSSLERRRRYNMFKRMHDKFHKIQK